MVRLILGLALVLGAAAPAGAQVVSAPTNAGSAQRENMADNVITMNRARVDALKEMLFEEMERLLALEQQAQSLIAVRKNLRCCQLQGVSTPWGDGKTFINTAHHGRVFLHGTKQEVDTARTDFNDTFRGEGKERFNQLVDRRSSRPAASGPLSPTDVEGR